MRYLWLILFLAWISSAQASKKYASPEGSPTNSGNTPDKAWSLAFALGNSSPLVPGDSLVLADGIYEGNFTSTINGAPGKPIVILAKNEGKAIIDVGKQRTTGTGLLINGSNTWFVGIHVTSSSLIRNSDASNGFAAIPYESGISVFGDNNKIINCWVYDVVGGGLELWRSGLNLEVYGSVIFNNGSQDLPRGTGHGMYIQHDKPEQPKLIENNFVFQNASQGINIFTSNPVNSGVIVRRNVSFNTGVIASFNPFFFRPPHNLSIGSQSNVSHNMEVTSNLFYSDLQGGRLTTNDVSNVTLGRTYSPNRDISFNDNIVVGGRNQVEFQSLERFSFQRNKLLNTHGSFFEFLNSSPSFPNTTWDSNFYSNIVLTSNPFNGLTFQVWKTSFFPFDSQSGYSPSPAKLQEVLITQNKYDPFRFHVSILNFSGSDQVELDFSDFAEFKNVAYQIQDVQNPFDQSQRISGIFDGEKIRFPMNWSKSLLPKGNMPFQPVHTDRTLGTFLLVFERNQNLPVEFPMVKESVNLYLDSKGKAELTPNAFLVSNPSEPFTYTSSRGFEFACQDLGSHAVAITMKNTRTGEEKTVQTVVTVIDAISPYFDAANATYLFDPVVGKVSISIADFDIVDFKDNCETNKTIVQDRFEITCSDIFQNPESPVWEFPVVLTTVDQSGNTFSKTVKAVIGNIIESKKISITSLDPLTDDGFSTLRLGDELQYTVLDWRKNGSILPNQNGKEIKVNSPGTYKARLLLSTGCTVESSPLVLENPDLPSEYRDDVTLELDKSGKAILTTKDVFGVSEGIANEVILGQTQFDCTDIGSQKVKVTLKYQSTPWNINLSYTEEFWINLIVKDTSVPVFVEKFTPVEFIFDLTVGELILNPLDFFTTLPEDNCGSDGTKIQLSQSKITCADVDPDKLTYYVFFEITVSDASGNSRTFPASAYLKLVESVKVSLSQNGVLYKASQVELMLGNELDYTVLEWRRAPNLIPGETGETLKVTEPGKYSAVLMLANGCMVSSEVIEVKESSTPYPPVKEIMELSLDESGKAVLNPESIFMSWPPADPNLDIKLGQSEFTCLDIGQKEVSIIIKNQDGQTWEEKTLVKIHDNLKPVLIPKNVSLELDVTKGVVEISPESVLEEFGDNCGLKSLTINKNRFTCEDLGKEFSVAVRAEDNSGNVTEIVSKVSVVRSEPEKVIVSGKNEICAGEKSILELSSSKAFEVVRWRRNGTEISGQTGKTLEVSEPGKYHAVIWYPGACLSETAEFEVKVLPIPTGEIVVDGNILRAPEGGFTYQWFRNGESIAGATSRTFTAHFMGEYSVELTSESGCKARLGAVTLTISGLGGKPVRQAVELKIYPNPASDRVILELPDGVLTSDPEITVYSSDGKNISSSVQITPLNDTEVEILLNRIANGTYLIWVVGEDQKSYFGKLVVVN